MIEQNHVDTQFDEKDIEQIFGGESVLSSVGGDVIGTRSTQQQERMQEETTHASDNLS